MLARANRTEKLDLRLTAQAKRTLRSAAEATHKTVSEFVLECALAKADEVLLDRLVVKLDAAEWRAFQEALDAPARPLPRLERLVREKTLLDREIGRAHV